MWSGTAPDDSIKRHLWAIRYLSRRMPMAWSANVSRTLTARGGTGTPAGTTAVYTRNVLITILQTSGGPGPSSGYGDWSTLVSYANSAVASINSGASTYNGCAISQWTTPSATYGVYPQSYASPTGFVSNSARWTAEDGNTSGAVLRSGYFALIWDVPYAATTGGSTTAFGQTFVGGTGGVASPATVSNISVAPGQGYSISVATDGYVTISYLQ